jgi:hypothetical protein
MPTRQKIIGIPWFQPESYAACCAVMADKDGLPSNYSDWLYHAKDLEAEVQAAGHRSLRVPLDPRDFPHWCRGRNLVPDAKARVRYANSVAFREAGFG